MKNPRSTIATLVMIILAILLTACGGKQANPEQVAEDFVTAALQGDTATVTHLVTTEGKTFVSSMVDAVKSNFTSGSEFRIVLDETVGNTTRLAAQFDVTVTEVLTAGQETGFLTVGYAYPTNRFSSYTTELKEILSDAAYKTLTNDDYMVGWNFVSILQGITSAESQPLYTLADGLTEETLSRWLNNPPSLDQNAITSIEAIATEIAAITEGAIDISGFRQQLQPHLDTIGEHLAHTRLLRRADSQQNYRTDPARKTFVRSLPLTLHKVDGKWLIAPG